MKERIGDQKTKGSTVTESTAEDFWVKFADYLKFLSYGVVVVRELQLWPPVNRDLLALSLLVELCTAT